ncbi:Rid family hydrolase [Daejeonella sp.]|jgi:enamine deaminase RidA (YjgF/YER057c/UK114 family)|uniref:Rid family hydrolase n=1 Tax=Daejeonella sp. TaxID=2805397 RepID=UPI0037C152BF
MKRSILLFFIFGSLASWGQSPDIQYAQTSRLKGSSDAVIVKNVPLAHTSQIFSLDKRGKFVFKGELQKQLGQIFGNLSKALNVADSGLEQVVKLNIYLKNTSQISEIQTQISKRFQSGKLPAVSYVTGNLSYPDALVSIDAIAVSSNSSDNFVKYLNFGSVQVSILPSGPVVYVSGQAAKGNLAESTLNTLNQLQETLHFLGLEKKDIVQIKSFINPIADLSIVQNVMAEFFKGGTIPPLVNVEWLSKDPLIEIELIASSNRTLSKSNDQIDFITPKGMVHSPVYTKVTRVNFGSKVYVSGLYGNTERGIKSELIDIFDFLDLIMKQSGSDLKHLLKATYYVSNDLHSAALNAIRPQYYDPKRPPAASKAMVKDVGAIKAGVGIDMIGVVIEK